MTLFFAFVNSLSCQVTSLHR